MAEVSASYDIELLPAGAVAVAGEVSAWLPSFPLPRQASFTVELKFAGAAINVNVDLEQGHARPATEGSTDANWVTAVYANGADAGVVASGITDTNTRIIIVRPAVTRFCRLKITGATGNGAGTTIAVARVTYVR
jgi:hypothetical protein